MNQSVRALATITRKTVQILRGEGINGIRRRLYRLSGSFEIVDKELLELSMNRIYDLPQVEISTKREKTLNVLVPAFDFHSISAGFFGVFQSALFFKRLGYNVRLVMFDNFYFNYEEAKSKFKNYPGLESLFDEVEVEYIGERKKPLLVSKHDTSLATVWYSAYFAKKIQDKCDGNPFFYLIQDYETHFYPGSTNALLAEQTYFMNYNAMFSTEPLKDYFMQHNIGGIIDRKLDYIVYNNCCSCHLPSYTGFKNQYNNKHKKRLVFYSRPVVNRNMYELGALLIIKAVEKGILDPDEWDFYGVGLGDANLLLKKGLYLQQMPRMNLKDYIESISNYDLGITLMASSHPSLLPFDLAGSGCVVLTNTCYAKTGEYLSGISKNIISCEADLNKLLDHLKIAVSRVEKLEDRYRYALEMKFPRTWDETWTERHKQWVNKLLGVPDGKIS